MYEYLDQEGLDLYDGLLKTDLSALKSEIGVVSYTPLDNKSINIHNSTVLPSNIQNEAGFCCICVPCVEGDVFHVTGRGGNTTRLWGFSNSSGVLISESAPAFSATNLKLVAPENAAYFAYNSFMADTHEVFKGYSPAVEIPKLIDSAVLNKNYKIPFTIGNITISGSGWTYSSITTRVCTPQGFTIHCYPGDIIGLTDYTAARYYIGWRKTDGTYNTTGAWLRENYTIVEEGNYVILITDVPEATVTNVNDLASLFFYKLLRKVNDVYEYVNTCDDELQAQISTIKTDISGLSNPVLLPSSAKFAMHRGKSSEAPDNTIPAFTLAGQGNAYGIETDVFETTDHEFVCFHDNTVDAMTDGTGSISSMTYAQVQALTIDAGNNIDQYPNLKIPKLIDYLNVCRRYGCVAFIEIKGVTSWQLLVEVVRNAGMLNSCVFITPGESVVKAIRQYTNAPIAVLGYDTTPTASLIALAEKYYNCWLDVNSNNITSATDVNTAHSKNIPVVVWLTDTTATAETFISYGVDVITSNSITTLN